jgi:hypothetical protein
LLFHGYCLNDTCRLVLCVFVLFISLVVHNL